MRKVSRENFSHEWEVLWNDLRSEFFKVEALQDYSSEDEPRSESLRAWKAGSKEEAVELMESKPLSSYTQRTRDKDVDRVRIHLVREPYTPYLEWEIEHYKYVNIPHGKENVFLASADDFPNCPDFMLFDQQHAVVLRYDKDGRMISADISEEGDDLSPFLELRARLVKQAEPL